MKLTFLNIVIILLISASTASAAVMRPQIASVTIEGCDSFSASHLKKLMETRKSTFWHSSRLHHDLLIYDIKQILDFYYGQGYQETKLRDLQIQWNADSSAVDIIISLDEGRPVLVDSVIIQGVEAEHLPEIRKLIPLKSGGRLDYLLIRQSVDNISRYYGEKAYLSATVSHNIQQEAHSALIVFQIDAGIKYYLHSIRVRGSEKTKDWVIRRESNMSAGIPLTLPSIDSYRRRLYRQGLFKTVHIESEIAGYDSLANLTVTVEENLPGEFSLGGGYGSEERARLSVQWNYINMDGRAAAVGAEGKISETNRFLTLKHFAPYILRSGLYFHGGIAYSYQIEPDFNRETLELSGALGYPFLEWWRIDWGYTFKHSTLLDLPPDLAEGFIGDNIDQYGVELIRDTRDSRIFTRSGGYYAASGAVSNPHGLLRAEFLRSEADFRLFHTMNAKGISAFQFKSGALFELENAHIPLEEKFFLGGANSIRGYGQNSLGPLTNQMTPQGGNFYYFLRQEFRYELRPPLYVKVFIDNGGLYSYFSQAKLADSVSAAGMGLGAVFGVWGGRIEYAWRLENGAKPGEIYFQIGQGF